MSGDEEVVAFVRVVEVYTDEASEHRWRAKAGNGEVVANGEGYKNQADLVDVVEKMFPDAELRFLDAGL